MRDERKKISQERFEANPTRVANYVRTAQVTVVVYNDRGPTLTLSPYREEGPKRRMARAPRNARTLAAPSLSLADCADDNMGGVWRLDEETKRELATPKWRKSLSRFSPSSLLRLTPVLPLLAWFKS